MKKIMKAVFFLLVIFFSACIGASCAGQNNLASYPAPDQDNDFNQSRAIDTANIIETQRGGAAASLPDWLSSYIFGGINEIEKIDFYRDKYLFISRNESANLNALTKWAANYSAEKDFPRLAAARIEQRMISAAAMYPDNEYGVFFEALVKKALNSEYPGAVKEEAYWIKTGRNFEFYDDRPDETNGPAEIYEYFIFLSIDKTALQAIIRNMMADVMTSVTITRAQRASVGRLQQNFFEGF